MSDPNFGLFLCILAEGLPAQLVKEALLASELGLLYKASKQS